VAVEIISELARRGVTVWAEGDILKLKPRSALDEDLLARLREHKPEILDALLRRAASCASSCYEVEPGCWIHHPWQGCKTVPPGRSPQVFKRVCWHCGGAKVCGCLVCWNPQTDEPGPCLPCRGTGEVDTNVF
jgi:hypothetical protein